MVILGIWDVISCCISKLNLQFQEFQASSIEQHMPNNKEELKNDNLLIF